MSSPNIAARGQILRQPFKQRCSAFSEDNRHRGISSDSTSKALRMKVTPVVLLHLAEYGPRCYAQGGPTMNDSHTDSSANTQEVTRADSNPVPLVRSPKDLRRMFFLISVGLFITTLGQPGVIGQLPFLFLLKNEFHFNAAQQANFFAIATFAWYLKPLSGLLCDSFPLFGTRRRSYLILAAAVAGLCWSLFAVAPRSYAAFFWLMVILNGAMVIASTTIGGILVEAGQEGGATGRLASVRYGIDGVINVIAGPLGGWLGA